MESGITPSLSDQEKKKGNVIKELQKQFNDNYLK